MIVADFLPPLRPITPPPSRQQSNYFRNSLNFW